MKAGKMLVCVLLLLALCLGMMSVTALAEGAVAEIDGAGGKEEMTSLADAVSSAFHYIGIHADIRTERDRDILYECFRKWKAGEIRRVNQK